MISILAIPGSLRGSSSSNHILKAVSEMAQGSIAIRVFDGLGSLPHFNDADDAPALVTTFREQVREADAVLICTPEYAFGIPGSLKNALDWTVSSGEFVNKPVGLITASSQGEKGHAALMLTLTAISARIVEDATLLIPNVRSKLDSNGDVKDPEVKASLRRVLDGLIHSI